tara:strand:- start:656 stop:1837 length:1182 start_codon:yes stop_codon:yes gene_type:complete
MTINTKEEIFNLKSFILYIKSNLITVISFTLLSAIFSSLYFINTPAEYKATINIFQKADLENNLITSNIADLGSRLRYDYTTEKLFKLYETNIKDERQIENLYQTYQLQNNYIFDERPDEIFSYFSFQLIPEYLTVSINTADKEFSEDFLKFVIPELNKKMISDLVNQLNSDFNYQNIIKDKIYEIEKKQKETQLKLGKDGLLDLKDNVNSQKKIIIDMLDQNILTAEALGWQEPQISILSSLSHKDENRVIIEEVAVSQFLSSTFNSYPAYLFGYDILKSVRKVVNDNKPQTIDNIIFNEKKKFSALEREGSNMYIPELEKEYFKESLSINFIKEQMNSKNFRIVNFNLSSITVENSKSFYMLYLIISVFFGFIFSLLFLFIRDLSITNTSK